MSNLLYAEIEKYLKVIINQNGNDPHYMLPSENQLAMRFGCSLRPVKHALHNLKQEGLIYGVQGKGIFVTQNELTSSYAKKTVCFLTPNIKQRFPAALFEGIQKHFRTTGLNLFISATEDIAQMENQTIDLAIDKQFDGLIIFPVTHENFNKSLLNLIVKKYPIVLVGRNIQGLNASSICTDHYEQMQIAIEHMAEKKHLHIGFITEGADVSNCYNERISAYNQYIKQKKHRCSHFCEMDFFSDRGSDTAKYRIDSAVADFFKQNPEITALITTNLAVDSILSYFKNNEEQLQSLDVIIFDQPEFSYIPIPSHWRVVDQHPAKMGEVAAEIITDQITNHTPSRQIVLKSTLGFPE